MPNKLFTQTIVSTPAILVVGTQTQLQQQVIEVLQTNGLPVINNSLVNPFKMSQPLDEVYKIVVVIDLNEYERYENISSFFSWLKSVNISTLFLLSGVTKLADLQLPYSQWLQQTKFQEKILQFLNSNFPHTPMCMGLDLLETSRLHPLFQDIKKQLIDGTIFNPQLSIYPQLLHDFTLAVSPILISPWNNEKILIKGKKTTTTQLINTLVAKNNASTSIVKIIDSPTKFEEISFVADQVKTSESAEVGEWVLTWINKNQLPPTNNQMRSESKKTPANLTRPKLAHNPVAPINVPSHGETPLINNTNTNFDQAVSDLFISDRVETKVKKISQIAQQKKVWRHTTHKKSTAFWIGLLLVGVCLGATFLVGVFWSSTTLLRNSVLASLREDSTKIAPQNSSSIKLFTSLVRAQTNVYKGIVSDWSVYPESLASVGGGGN